MTIKILVSALLFARAESTIFGDNFQINSNETFSPSHPFFRQPPQVESSPRRLSVSLLECVALICNEKKKGKSQVLIRNRGEGKSCNKETTLFWPNISRISFSVLLLNQYLFLFGKKEFMLRRAREIKGKRSLCSQFHIKWGNLQVFHW